MLHRPMTTSHSQTPDQSDSAGRRWWSWPFIAAVGAVCVFFLLLPTQTIFRGDEPVLISRALRLNASGQIARVGLLGTQGRFYGPLPTWIYQVFVAITHSPAAIMSLHIVLFTGGVIAALAWLGRTLRVWRWGLVAIVLSPYVWFYARHLWDNSFNIPLSVLCVAAYASFLNRPRVWTMMVAIVSAGLMLLVHLMAMPLVAALLLHLLVARWRDVAPRWQAVLIALAVVGLVGFNYWPELQRYDPKILLTSSAPNGWWFPLLGPRVLSGGWIDYFFPAPWIANGSKGMTIVFLVLQLISLAAFAFTWLGLGIGLVWLVRRWHAEPTVSQDLASFCAVALLGQILLNGPTHTFGHPHYYNGTWGAFAALFWIGLDQVARWRWGRVAGYAEIGSLAAMCVLLFAKVVGQHGTREMHFGPTMANQMQVLRDWAQYRDDSPISVNVMIVPASLQTLKVLNPPPLNTTGPKLPLVIRYASENPNDGKIEIVPAAPER
jgi:hypothetical protein